MLLSNRRAELKPRKACPDNELTPDIARLGGTFIWDKRSYKVKKRGFRNKLFSHIRENIDLRQQAFEYQFLKGGLTVDANYREHQRRRETKRAALVRKGVISNYFGRELHIGELPCICRICPGAGYASRRNIPITMRCNKECFFCIRNLRESGAGHDYIGMINEVLESGDSDKYISFIGGEPLLELGKLLDGIHRAKTGSDGKCFTSVYTNGSLLAPETLSRLKNEGLDEIKINVAAIDYDSAPVFLAAHYIDRVIAEFPVIPEDMPRIAGFLARLHECGHNVSVIFHEFMYRGGNNAEGFRRRGYVLKNPKFKPFYFRPMAPILGSEEAVYDLLLFAIERRLNVPLHYCSCELNELFQDRNRDFHLAGKNVSPYRRLDRSGLTYSLIIGSGDKEAVLGDLPRHAKGSCAVDGGLIELSPDSLPYLDLKKYEVSLCLRHFETIVDIGALSQ